MKAPQSNRSEPLWQFLYAARPAQQEQAFRDYYLPDDIGQLSFVLYVVMGLMALISAMDLLRPVQEPEVTFGIGIRIFMIAVGLVTVMIMKKSQKSRVVDVTGCMYAIVCAVGIAAFHIMSDPGALRVAIIATLYVFVVHLAFPMYAAYSIFPTMLFLGSEGYTIVSSTDPDFVDNRAIVIAVLFTSLVIALMSSAQIQRAKYRAFVASQQVRTLSGLIPICSNCKSIRNDDGFYEKIERYVEDHSHAEFTHGICPDCMKSLYPDLATEAQN